MNLSSFVAISGLFVMGTTASIIGAFKHELSDRLAIDNTKVGGLVSALTITSMLTSLILGVLIDSTGYRAVAFTGFLFTSLAVYLLVSVRSYPKAVLSCVVLGIGGMSLNSFGSTLVTVVLFDGGRQSLALTIGHIFASVGAMGIPLVMGLFLARFGFRRIGIYIAVVLVLPLPFVCIADLPTVPSGFQLVESLKLLSNPAVLSAAIALFFYIGTEASFGAWTTSYLANSGVSKRVAEYALTLFWFSLLLGRVLTAQFIKPEQEMPFLIIMTSITALATFAMILNQSGRIGIVLTLLCGLTLGPVFPVIVGRIFSVVAPSLKGSAFGILLATGLFGAVTIPVTVGAVSKGRQFRYALTVTLTTVLGLLVMSVITSRLT